jgi:hypothetical protein
VAIKNKKDLIAILLDAVKKEWKPQTVIDAVDTLWREPIKTPQSGHLTDIKSATVNVAFKQPFSTIPAGLPRLYRMVPDGGVYLMQDVLFSYPSADWLTPTGFSIIIDPSEELEGIVMTYQFIEINK